MLILHPLQIPNAIKEGVAQSALKSVPVFRARPSEPFKGPRIVCRIEQRRPGADNHETKKGRVRAEIQDDDGTVRWIWGQAATCVVQFDFFHNSDDEVDELVMRFESFVLEYRPALIENGLASFLFVEQLPDNYLQVPKDVPNRTMRYEATMSVLHEVSYSRIQQVALSVTDNIQFTHATITRSQTLGYDEIDAADFAILGLYSSETSSAPDYIADVDYRLERVDAGATKIVWLPGALTPAAGGTYVVRYTLAKELNFREIISSYHP